MVFPSSSSWSGFSCVVDVGSICGVAALSATLSARSTACLSGEGCVSVCGEPCGVKVGDTASSSIRVARSTLCSMERDEVDWIIDRSSGLSPAKPCRWSVIVAIDADLFGGRIQSLSMCRSRFRSVQSVDRSWRSLTIFRMVVGIEASWPSWRDR